MKWHEVEIFVTINEILQKKQTFALLLHYGKFLVDGKMSSVIWETYWCLSAASLRLFHILLITWQNVLRLFTFERWPINFWGLGSREIFSEYYVIYWNWDWPWLIFAGWPGKKWVKGNSNSNKLCNILKIFFGHPWPQKSMGRLSNLSNRSTSHQVISKMRKSLKPVKATKPHRALALQWSIGVGYNEKKKHAAGGFWAVQTWWCWWCAWIPTLLHGRGWWRDNRT